MLDNASLPVRYAIRAGQLSMSCLYLEVGLYCVVQLKLTVLAQGCLRAAHGTQALGGWQVAFSV